MEDGDPTDDEKLDPLVLDNLEVHCRAEVPHVDPASSPLDCILRPDRQESARALTESQGAYLSILLFSQDR